MANVLTVTKLRKKFHNNRGIENISFSIDEGDIFGLLGANGAGKTTTMKIIAGLIRKNSGDISILGKSAEKNFEDAIYHVGSLIEMPAFYGYMSARKNMILASKYYIRDKITNDMIDKILSDVRLYEYRFDKVSKFSLGMKQRLGLALAMIGNPSLYILDEPANGLDIVGIIEIRNVILEMARGKKTSFLVSSHQSAEIQKLCNKVGVIHDGVLRGVGLMSDILGKFPSVEDYYMYCVTGKEVSDEINSDFNPN